MSICSLHFNKETSFDKSQRFNELSFIKNTPSFLSSYNKGISAEFQAEKELKKQGYKILGKRVRTRYGEIDILAKKNNDLVAVEVKQRKSLDAARACISYNQRRRISNSLMYIVSNGNELFENYRADVICLDSAGRFEHIENAFPIEEFSSMQN
ncbi:MAG: YraN family protein [Holosporales bacterium]|jgi:putative endonuclease|nr:YraN family protein [Holosporales bacterium]